MRFRLLVMGPLDGASNMAMDEAILRLGLRPTLRLYSWSHPCLSIGYSQPLAEVDQEACRRLDIDLVRRPTGGGAILHHWEVTYSLVAPEGHPAVSGAILDSYRKVSRGLAAGLARLGLAPEMAPAAPGEAAPGAACFHNPSAYELTVGGRKIAGSAQCRRRGVVLQHGSLLLDLDRRRALEVLRPPAKKSFAAWVESLQSRATCLRETLGRPVSFEEVAGALVEGFQEALGLELEAGQPDPEEWETAKRLRWEKYTDPAWTMAR